MQKYTVVEVFDGDTFRVTPHWVWRDREGDIVRPLGYNTPEKGKTGYEEAKTRLTNLILNEKVEIRSIEGIDSYGRLLARAYYNGMDLADYFPEYQDR